MKIIELKAANIKNLKAVDIKPDGDAVVLRGKNAAGKSAVLDSIFMALTGKKVAEPIRKGQKKGEVRVDLGEYEVRRTFTDKGTYLEVLSKNGASFKSPQTMLDKILGELSFDPLAFATEKPAAQRATLMSLAGLDFAKIDEQRQKIFEQRTLVNRQLRDVQGELENLEAPDEDTPKEEVSISGVAGLVNGLREKRAAHETWEREKLESTHCIHSWKERISELEGELAPAKEQLEAAIEGTREIVEQEPINPTDEDVAKGEAGIALAEQTNIQVRAAQTYRQKQGKADSLKSLSEKMTDNIQGLDEQKISKIGKAKYPINDLGIDEKQVLYNDLPLSQLSSGEQIKVSTAVAMALNPKLRVLCVREGSLLDAEGLEAIQQQAKKKDYQLWIEVVGEKGVGVLIQEGEIKTKKGAENV